MSRTRNPEPQVRVNLQMPHALKKELAGLATASGATLSDFIREACEAEADRVRKAADDDPLA